MAVKAIVQLHERSTTAALEADLQLRELGLDAQTNSLTVSSELDATKWHIITKEHTAPSLDNALTLSSTLTVVGASTLAALSATTGSFSSTLSVTGIQTNQAALTFGGNGSSAVGSIWKSAAGGLNLRGVTGSTSDLQILSASSGSLLTNPTGTNNVAIAGSGGATTIGGTLVVTGLATLSSGASITGAGGGGAGRLYYDTSSDGIVLRANTGATNDFTLYSQNAGTLIVNPTGTRNLTLGNSGGTVTLPMLSSGRIPVVSTAGLITQDNLYWDATNDRLGIGSGASSPSINLNIDAAVVGDRAGIIVRNSDNANTASSSVLEASVNGSGAGDAYSRYLVSGVTSWVAGVDNSDNDAFVITQSNTPGGATNGLRISTAGAVTIPGTLGVTGVTTLSQALVFSANGTSGTGRLYKDSSYGLTIRGIAGSLGDFTLRDAAGAVLIGNPTGTNNLAYGTTGTHDFYGNLTAHNAVTVYTTATLRQVVALTGSSNLGTLSTSAGAPTSFSSAGLNRLYHTTDPGGVFASYVTLTGATDGQLMYVYNTTTTILYITNGTTAVNPLSSGVGKVLVYNDGDSTWYAY